MRDKLGLILVVLLTIGAIFTGYIYADKSAKLNKEHVESITVTQEAVTEKPIEKTLLVEDKKNDCHFYIQADNVILEYKGEEYVFTDWSKYIATETPELFVKNFDDDKEKEIILKIVGELNSDGSYIRHVYILNIDKDENGKHYFHVNALTQNTFNYLIRRKIKAEITQAKYCDKIGIVAMCLAHESIAYDRNTGIPESYYYPFKLLQDKNGNYLQPEKWERGVGEYTIEEDGVYATLPITVSYKGTKETQQAGFIKCMIWVFEDYQIDIVRKSMRFSPNIEYGVYKPELYANKKWSSVLNNSNKATGGDTLIDFIQYEHDYTAEINTDDFSKNNSDLNKLSKIEVNQDCVKLYAKSGYTFSKEFVEKQQYSLPLEIPLSTEFANYDTSYTANISTDKKGNQVLTINFDNQYDQKYMTKLSINFGVK